MLRIVLAVLLSVAAVGQVNAAYDCAYDPARSKLSRIVAADSTNAPIYGQIINVSTNRSQNRTLALRDKEVVLTFDDGPLAGNTTQVLDTLDKHCVKAVFFMVGRMAVANPKLAQEIERRGHTVGTHTWSHPRAMDLLPIEDVKAEIEKGFAAVSYALGKPIAPFFRFPGLRDNREAVNYLARRNISVWTVDVVSGDTDPGATAAKISRDTISRIRQLGRGIVLFHDIKKITADALDGILTDLTKDGYRFVQVVSNTNYQPNAELLATSGIFKTAPASTPITGQWVASAKQQLKDGNVDVMQTEWIDLKRVSDRISGQGNERQGSVRTTADRPATRVQPDIRQGADRRGAEVGARLNPVSDSQQGATYSASSWSVGTGRIR